MPIQDDIKTVLPLLLKAMSKRSIPQKRSFTSRVIAETLPPNQTSPEGRAKFKYELETVWLCVLTSTGNKIIVAKVSQKRDKTNTVSIFDGCTLYEDELKHALPKIRAAVKHIQTNQGT